MEFTVMTYNIKAGNAQRLNQTGDPYAGLQRVANLIHQHDPDIVALQEVDRFMPRSQHIDQPAWLAEALGRSFAYSPSFIQNETPHGRPQYGNAILSRYPIVAPYHHHLFHRAWLLPGESAWVMEPRSMLEAQIDMDGRRLAVYSLHLSTTADQQAFQLDEIGRILAQVDMPQVVMGDFNTSLAFRMMKVLCEGRVHALSAAGLPAAAQYTFPEGRNARSAIDHIITSPTFQLVEAAVIVDEEGVSDHNPVWARLRL